MDPLHILRITLYSKIFNELATKIDFTQYNHYFENMKSGIISPAKVQQIYLKYDTSEIEQCLIALVDATNL